MVSILILLEVPLQLYNITNEEILSVLFQSLFYWKYHFNSSVTLGSVDGSNSFNPYFTGSTTSTKTVYGDNADLEMFQSLFYWKYHFNIYGACPNQAYYGVSILILLEVPLQRWLMTCQVYKLGLCFNPYFTGSTTSTRNFVNSIRPRKCVSILILLEVPLQLILLLIFHRLTQGVSILILLEVPLQRYPSR